MMQPGNFANSFTKIGSDVFSMIFPSEISIQEHAKVFNVIFWSKRDESIRV